MNSEKMKDYTLNNKEYKEITKAHDEFNKTIFGKKVKMFNLILGVFAIFFIFMSFVCLILNATGEKNFDIYAAICGALFFTNTSLLIASQIQYENMVMNYIDYKK